MQDLYFWMARFYFSCELWMCSVYLSQTWFLPVLPKQSFLIPFRCSYGLTHHIDLQCCNMHKNNAKCRQRSLLYISASSSCRHVMGWLDNLSCSHTFYLLAKTCTNEHIGPVFVYDTTQVRQTLFCVLVWVQRCHSSSDKAVKRYHKPSLPYSLLFGLHDSFM